MRFDASYALAYNMRRSIEQRIFVFIACKSDNMGLRQPIGIRSCSSSAEILVRGSELRQNGRLS